MSAGTPPAAWRAQTFESVRGFLPDRVQITVPALVVLVVVASWAVRTERRTAHRRATRAGRPVHAEARYGPGSGADHLGRYAPQPGRAGRPVAPAPAQVTAGQSGADFPGAHAPGQQRPGPGAGGPSAPHRSSD
ncbi:hypothetical protein [Streptomyces sp. NBRC 110035]|uniref:hypothetical protein n=1 Tax=Streptomyces sp. NBRC 110035 TaxID=1547867 RepID=UPI0005A7E078|nr:hypothetical protein [Streptomyces sp. NBRC 110035]